jgi:hypothetical protein
VYKYLLLFLFAFGLFYLILFHYQPSFSSVHSESGHQHIPHDPYNTPADDKRDWDKMGSLIGSIEVTLSFATFTLSIIAAFFGFYLKELVSDIKRVEKIVDNKLETFSIAHNKNKKQLKNFKETDKKVIFNRKATEKTLIKCLNKSDGDLIKALNRYTRLTGAYDVLLPCDDSNELSATTNLEKEKLLERMQMEATILYAEKEYVPTFVTDMLLDEKRLPPAIRKIIISGK